MRMKESAAGKELSRQTQKEEGHFFSERECLTGCYSLPEIKVKLRGTVMENDRCLQSQKKKKKKKKEKEKKRKERKENLTNVFE